MPVGNALLLKYKVNTKIIINKWTLELLYVLCKVDKLLINTSQLLLKKYTNIIYNIVGCLKKS